MRGLGLLALLALGALALVFTADHDAWTPDEPRVVALGASAAHGSWLAPRLNGEPFLEQPPLHAWSVGGAYRAFGETVAVARGVSAAWSVLTLLVTFLLGERLGGRRVGILSALLLGTSALFIWAEHRVTADPPLAFFVAGSAYASLRGLTAEKRGERFIALILAFCGASLAYLSKGVVGVGLAGFAWVAVALALQDAKTLLRGHLWLAPICFGIVTASYHLRLWEECGLEAVRTVVYEQTMQRAGTGEHHVAGPEYYLWSFPLNFLPSTLFLVGGVIWFFREKKLLDAKGLLAWEMPLIWLALGLVALSIVKSKREIYVLPLLPAGALVGGLWLDRVIERQDESPIARHLPHVFGVVLVLAALALPVGVGGFLKLSWLVPILGAAIGVGTGVGALVFASTERPGRSLAVTLVGTVAVVLCADLAIVPWGDSKKGLTRPVADAVAHVPSNRVLYALCPDETALGFITFGTGRDVAALPSRSAFERIQDPFGEGKKELLAHLHGERELWVLAIEKRETPDIYNSVKSLDPEVISVWPLPGPDKIKGREVRLLHFKAR
jgi:4-amino-4-deoxy-L-arabinose transferase-like glycosyltransferase